MPYITLKPEGKVLEYHTGKSLLNLLLDAGVYVDNPCNGKGTCGKCKVRFCGGLVPEVSPTEVQRLKVEEVEAGIRLSCMVYPKEDISIEVLSKEGQHQVLTEGYIPEFAFNLAVRKHLVSVHSPNLEDQTPWEEQILNQLKEQGEDQCKEIPYDLLKEMDGQTGTYTVTVRQGDILHIEKGDYREALYGVAVDIGTTTVVCSLVDLRTGRELANASMINAQKQYGMDVLTRITYELEHREEGIANLQKAIVDALNDMILDMTGSVGIDSKCICQVTVGANTTMMHMLLGVDAVSIGKSPYVPVFTEAREVLGKDLGLCIAPKGCVYCLPCVSAFIGADIVAGAYVCKLKEAEANALFIDIGTNGEIVLSQQGRLLCCSCAAGPALEGMNISAGMRASKGAIEDVRITEDGIELQVIGHTKPIGICGSGILAAVKELVGLEYVKKNGTFVKPDQLQAGDPRLNHLKLDGKKRQFVLVAGEEGKQEELLITQDDIRQVQLAKGAILSGFLTLLKKADLTMEDLDQVIIAGQFGAHLPAASLTGTGILPKEVEEKLAYVGNTSKTGAYMALMSDTVKREMEALAQEMEYLELGDSKDYDRLFASCMVF